MNIWQQVFKVKIVYMWQKVCEGSRRKHRFKGRSLWAPVLRVAGVWGSESTLGRSAGAAGFWKGDWLHGWANPRRPHWPCVCLWRKAYHGLDLWVTHLLAWGHHRGNSEESRQTDLLHTVPSPSLSRMKFLLVLTVLQNPLTSVRWASLKSPGYNQPLQWGLIPQCSVSEPIPVNWNWTGEGIIARSRKPPPLESIT